MPANVWNTIASSAVQDLGRTPATGEVSLDKFVTDWNKYSPMGKAILFGGQPHLASSLDDLATIAGRAKQVKTFANPSGTAQTGALLGLGAAALNPAHWPYIAGTGALGHFLTRALSQPATAKSMASWAQFMDALQRRAPQAVGRGIQFGTQRFGADIGQAAGLGSVLPRYLSTDTVNAQGQQ
jgi:hypothetical protein